MDPAQGNNLYNQLCSIDNLTFAWLKARKHKTKKYYVKAFEANLLENLLELQEELVNQTYKPSPLKTFVLRDPKTRKISKSAFRDRIVHHALVGVIEPIFEKRFIYDSCANRKGKGNLFALQRFDKFKRKATKNFASEAFCLKADIRHYFQEVDRNILMEIIKKEVNDDKVIWLVRQILENSPLGDGKKGMPLGNLTSQFFALVYLNELDYFVKHHLRAKYYIRYVDDFVILHKSREQLEEWKSRIDQFLSEQLKLKLHPEKSKIIPLARGVDFVGFRNFYRHRLLRKRNVRKMFMRIEEYEKEEIGKKKFLEIFQGWQAYARWANTFNLRKEVIRKINNINDSTACVP